VTITFSQANNYFTKDFYLRTGKEINSQTNSTFPDFNPGFVTNSLIKSGYLIQVSIEFSNWSKIFWIHKADFESWKQSHRNSFPEERRNNPQFAADTIESILTYAVRYYKVPGLPLSKTKIKEKFDIEFENCPYKTALEELLNQYLENLKDGDPLFSIDEEYLTRIFKKTEEECECLNAVTYQQGIVKAKKIYPDVTSDAYKELIKKLNISFAYRDIYPFLFKLPGAEHSE